MTSTEPDTDILAVLDFEPVILCDVGECAHTEARHAVVTLVFTKSCCTARVPVCIPHREAMRIFVSRNQLMGCDAHGTRIYARDAITFEPLP